MSRRIERLGNQIKELAAEFILKNFEGNLITVSNIFLPANLKKATIYITVWPEEKEAEIVSNLQKKIKELRYFLGQKIKTRFVPEVEIKLDPGRKTRQVIDQLSRRI